MTIPERLQALHDKACGNARNCIFPFWASEFLIDRENGGFYSRVTLDMQRSHTEPNGLVLAGRMVYAFSSAYRYLKDPLYLERAGYAFDDLVSRFYDKKYGGAYSAVNCGGAVADWGKNLYGEAFFVMACAAYFHASGDENARRLALETFEILEAKVKRGPADYPNNLKEDWSIDQSSRGRLHFPADAKVFPHHLCQAYEQLFRATGDPRVKAALREMAEGLAGPYYDRANRCFRTFLDRDGKRAGTHQSYGHDCELSYLGMDIALLTGDQDLISRMSGVCEAVLRKILTEDFDPWHSLYNGADLATGKREKSHVWWAQAEAVTAMLFGYQLTGDEAFLTACEQQLDYILRYFVNREDGDWYNNIVVDSDGCRVVDGMHGFDKLNEGKCPFHNSHMCFEVMRRTEELQNAGEGKPLSI